MDRATARTSGPRGLLDSGQVMDRVVNEALLLVPGADGAVVELIDQEEFLLYVAAAGSLKPYVGTRLMRDGSLSGLAIEQGTTMRCDDASTDPRVDWSACRRLDVVSMVCVPLSRGGQPIGVLKVSAAGPWAFTDDDVETLDGLGRFVGVCLAAAKDYDELMRAATSRVSSRAAATRAQRFMAGVMEPE